MTLRSSLIPAHTPTMVHTASDVVEVKYRFQRGAHHMLVCRHIARENSRTAVGEPSDQKLNALSAIVRHTLGTGTVSRDTPRIVRP